MSGAWNKMRWSLRQRGFQGTLLAALGRVSGDGGGPPKMHPFDLKYGTDTGGVIGGGSLGGGHAHDAFITAYAGMPPSRFEATMRRWLGEPHVVQVEDITFADLGCGKGRVVLLALRWGFARVLGVELDPTLARTARGNVARWLERGEQAAAIEIVTGDATELELPPGPCVLYLANPFGAVVMRRLLEKLEARRVSGGGGVDLIYQNAVHRSVFDASPGWRLLWDEAFPLSEEDLEAEPVYGVEDRCVAWRHD